VTRGDLPVIVTERGELDSSKTEDIRCGLEGRQNKIVFIEPEGTHVTKGQVVVRLDADDLTRDTAKQESVAKQARGKADAAKEELEVQKNKAAGDVAKAKLALTLAELDLEKYVKAEFRIDYDDKMGAIKLAERELEDAKEKLKNYETFVKKGFGVPEQLTLKRIEVERAEANLERDKNKLMLLNDFQRRRQETELKAKADDAKLELERTERSSAAAVTKARAEMEAAEQTAKIEEASLKRFQKQLALCEVKSPADGIMVYTHERDWDPSYRIQTGGVVFYQETLARLPDLTKMEVKVRIHESKVKKIKAGQKAEIRIASLPDLVLHGTVTTVATVADSEGRWRSGDVKEYITIVKIEDLPEGGVLLPGMTAEMSIKVNHLSDVLMVPVQAVTQRGGQYVAYVKVGRRVERREVTVGENNEKYIEIKSGLAEGEQVLLDARARNAEEMKAEEAKNPPPPAPRETQAPPGPR
jgi:HlyD family secretion protein